MIGQKEFATSYYESGKLKQEGTYKNDKSEGIYKYYYENRKLVNAGTHKDGNLKMNL